MNAMEIDIPEVTILDDTSTSSSSTSRSSSTIPSIDFVTCSRLPPKGFTGAEALQLFRNNLTPYEQHEILVFPKVFFTGNITQKLQPENPGKGGYDDAKGSYRIVMQDHLGYRYEVYKALGSGSFGQVYKCFDHKRKKEVAVKIVRNTPKVAQSAQIEGNHLLELNTLPGAAKSNIIKLLNFFDFRGHQCVVFELMGISLYDLLKKRKFKGLTNSQVKPIAIEILTALNFLKMHKIMHCDLKPENVLFYPNSYDKIKLIDFGSSSKEGQCYYTYIQSRFYRAPEVLLNAPFGTPIDMWSFGCIVYELIAGYPLFPGENRNDQLTVIMEVCGVPPQSLRARGKVSNDYFRSCGQPKYLRTKKMPDGTSILVADKSPKQNIRLLPGNKTWEMVFKTRYEPKLVNFLKRCLEYEPVRRYLPSQAMSDAFLQEEPEYITID